MHWKPCAASWRMLITGDSHVMLDRPERELALSVFYHDSYLKINASVWKRRALLVGTFADKTPVMTGKCARWAAQNELRRGCSQSH